MKLEKRMYFFVVRNLSEIAKGIQSGHAALEYVDKYKDDLELFHFIKNDKTWILLNGGTSLEMNDIQGILYDNNIKYAEFKEPDLNNLTTSICVIVDERVYDYKKYPNYDIWMEEKYNITGNINELKYNYNAEYKQYIELIGVKNIILRDLIYNKKLA